MEFRYHFDILTRYPEVRGGVILAQNMKNAPTPQALQEAFLTEQQAALDRIGDTPLSELNNLSAWRGAFRAFDVNPTKYRSACEALLRRLTKKGDIPSINTLVDICNLISIRYTLPVAAFDVRALHGTVMVHFAEGTERFTTLGEADVEHPEPGEVVFSDESSLVIARRWCWRQSADSATRLGTRDAIFTIESQHAGGQSDVQSAQDDLLELLKKYVGGVFKSDLLGPGSPLISL